MTTESVTIEDDRPPIPEPPETEIEPPESDVPPAPDEVPLVEVSEIADAIGAIGETIHGLAGQPEVPEHWGFTETEITQLAPPVTALINRHARARAIAQRSPELAVALILSRWGIRNARLSAAIRQAKAELETEDEAGRHQTESPQED